MLKSRPRFPRFSLFLLLLVWVISLAMPVRAQTQQVLFLHYEGAVTPSMLAYLERGLEHAAEQDAALVIFAIDTPGGAVDITKDISQAIQQSSVPVAVYVYPARAWAASAGTIITLSGHVAAMAPESFIGAASPVGSSGEDLPETAKQKAEEALSATARALAERRGEEVVAWASETVLSAEAATAEEALAIGAIDVIARDAEDLLAQLDGREVLVQGEEKALDLAGAEVVDFAPTAVEDFLAALANPTVAVILLTLGLNAILYELSAPGGYVAGAVGIIALLLAFYSLGTLDANYAGLALIAVALALIVIDLKVQSGGALSVGGLAAFVLGAAVLFNTSYYAVPWATILGVTTAMALFVLVALRAVVKTQRSAPFSGGVAAAGMHGRARSELDPDGMVFVQGAWWEATSEDGDIEAGEQVEVTRREGYRLWVQKAKG